MNKIINLEPILIKYPTDIYGLDFFPSLEPYFSNDRDACFSGDLRVLFDPPLCSINYKVTDGAISQRAYDKTVEVVKSFNRDIFIMEIGVDRDPGRTFTHALLSNKTPNSTYLGVDLDDKSKLNSPSDRIFTLKTDSRNQDYIRNYIKYQLKIEKIDILMIDGYHSINCTISDWKFVDLLSEDGVILLHDTGHPGPAALLESINKNMFNIDNSISSYSDDYGMAVIIRRNQKELFYTNIKEMTKHWE